MTAQEYANKTTIGWDEFLHRVAAGRYTAAQLKATNWYKAGAELEAGKAQQPPPSTDPLAAYRSLCFMAQNPLDALKAPPYFRVLFTADPAYGGWATAGAAAQLRTAGHEVGVWYVPTEVSKARADEVAARLGTSFVMGQCESRDQFDMSVAHGRKAMVGSLSALTGAQLAAVAAGQAIVVNELYRNCQPNQQPDWRNANKGVPGNCVAVYGDGQCKRMPLSQYIADGMFVPHRDSVYGPGMTLEDWKVLS